MIHVYMRRASSVLTSHTDSPKLAKSSQGQWLFGKCLGKANGICGFFPRKHILSWGLYVLEFWQQMALENKHSCVSDFHSGNGKETCGRQMLPWRTTRKMSPKYKQTKPTTATTTITTTTNIKQPNTSIGGHQLATKAARTRKRGSWTEEKSSGVSPIFCCAFSLKTFKSCRYMELRGYEVGWKEMVQSLEDQAGILETSWV